MNEKIFDDLKNARRQIASSIKRTAQLLLSSTSTFELVLNDQPIADCEDAICAIRQDIEISKNRVLGKR